MEEENFELRLEIYVIKPLKLNQKKELVQLFVDQLHENGIKDVTLENSHYEDKRSAESTMAIVLGLSVAASILSIVSSCFNIHSKLGQEKIPGKVFVRRKDGSYIKIEDEITEEEILRKLQNNKDHEKTE